MGLLNLVVHGDMLLDARRNEALARAIEDVVRPGDIVADVGAGTGLLAMLAARAGAKQVYAIERGPISSLARGLVALNNADDVVQVISDDVRNFQPDQQVDVVLCETLGMACLDEGFRETIADVRDRMLKPGGRLVPSDVEIFVAPVRYSVQVDRLDQLDTVLGLNFAPFADLLRKVHRRAHFDEGSLLAPGQPVWHLHCSTFRSEEDLHASISMTAADDATIGGFVLWFNARLSPTVVLSNWRSGPANHWGQAYLPVKPRLVSAGEEIRLTLSIRDRPGRFLIQWREGDPT